MDGWQCCAHELRTTERVFNQTAPLAATPAGPFALYRASGLREAENGPHVRRLDTEAACAG